MSKGVIVRRPGGAMPTGKIIVVENFSANGVIFKPGTVVSYTEVNVSEEGDVVDFSHDGRLASGIISSIKGTVITGDYDPDLTINVGQSYLISAGILKGVHITVSGGYLVVVQNSEIRGRITSSVPNSCILIDNGTTMNGDINVDGASILSVKNSTTAGSISSDGSTFTNVTDNVIRGNLSVTNAVECNCIPNNVTGNTNTPGCP